MYFLDNIFKKLLKPVPKDGFEAYNQGFRLEANPYRQNTPDHSIWRDDWLFCARCFK